MNNTIPTQQQLSSKRGFPLRLFAAAFVISLLGSFISAWQSWQIEEYSEAISMKHIALTENIGRIMLLDEALTMSARMAAGTGDFSYEKRYDQFDPLLTTEIDKVRAMLPQASLALFVNETDEANNALVKIERQAFALTHQDKRQEAMALLTGDEYMRLKNIYADGMKKTANAANGLIESEARHLHTLHLRLAVAGVIGVLVLLMAWFLAVRSARSWVAERKEAEEVLRQAHDELEVQVVQRTAGLSSTNEQLQHEIAEHKRSEEALRISTLKHQLLFESSRDALMLLTPPSWKFTGANQATLQLFGASSVAEFTALGPWDVSPERQPDGRPSSEMAQEAIMTAMREGSHHFEWEHQRLGGQPFAADVLLTRMEVGEDVFLQATVRDITERKLAESLLRLHSDILKNLAEGVYLIRTSDGVIVFASPQFERIFGYESGELLGKHVSILNAPTEKSSEEIVAAIMAALAQTGTWRGDLQNIRKDGTTFWCHASVSAFDHPQFGKVYVSTHEDITRRKQAENEILRLNDELEEKVMARTAALEQAKLELEQANRGKDEFLAAISHELKTPLNHILGFADLLKEGLVGELSAEQKGMVQDIFDAGSKQLGIVNSLIELARLQADKVKLQAKPEAPAQMLGEIATLHAAKAKASGLAFAVEMQEGLCEMPLDREVVTHLLDQLLANACKFTPSGGKISLTARRVPRSDVAAPVRIEADEYLELAVADNGPGIAPEILPRLFQPFVQGDGRLNRRYAGTGIGLTLVRLLAELHGGGSGVESKPGIGAKFLVWLPIGKQQQ